MLYNIFPLLNHTLFILFFYLCGHRVEEDFQNLLNLGVKPKIKPKPKIPAKPSFLKETKNSDNNLAQVDSQPNVQAMDETDILRYIKENESSDNDSPSLF